MQAKYAVVDKATGRVVSLHERNDVAYRAKADGQMVRPATYRDKVTPAPVHGAPCPKCGGYCDGDCQATR